MEQDILKKSNDHLQQSIEMKYQLIKDNRFEYTMVKMCRVLEISMNGFYHWLKRPYAVREIKNERLKDRIRQLYTEHNGMAGSPMITSPSMVWVTDITYLKLEGDGII